MKDMLYQKRTKYSWPKRGAEYVGDFPSHISVEYKWIQETNAKVTVCQNLQFSLCLMFSASFSSYWSMMNYQLEIRNAYSGVQKKGEIIWIVVMHLMKTVGRITRKDKLTVKTRAKFSQNGSGNFAHWKTKRCNGKTFEIKPLNPSLISARCMKQSESRQVNYKSIFGVLRVFCVLSLVIIVLKRRKGYTH